jgi:hypothetical protein
MNIGVLRRTRMLKAYHRRSFRHAESEGHPD